MKLFIVDWSFLNIKRKAFLVIFSDIAANIQPTREITRHVVSQHKESKLSWQWMQEWLLIFNQHVVSLRHVVSQHNGRRLSWQRNGVAVHNLSLWRTRSELHDCSRPSETISISSLYSQWTLETGTKFSKTS